MASNLWTPFSDVFSLPAFATRTRLSDFFFGRRGSMNLFHRGILFIIPLLIAFLQLKYQGTQVGPFTTDPKTMTLSVFTTSAYYLSQGVLLRPGIPPRCADLLRHSLVWFGNSSAALLASMFLPRSIRPFLYVLFALVSSDELLRWMYRTLFGEEDGDRQGTGRFLDNLGRLVGNSFSDRRFILPRSRQKHVSLTSKMFTCSFIIYLVLTASFSWHSVLVYHY